jgi:hypothetical protein
MVWIVLIASYLACQFAMLTLLRRFYARKATLQKVALTGGVGNALSVLAFGVTATNFSKGSHDTLSFITISAIASYFTLLWFIAGYVGTRHAYGAYLKSEAEKAARIARMTNGGG